MVARVLIAEDDPAIRRVLERVLTREGHTVETAANGREALTSIQQALPDLLLLDLKMPVIDGWEVYRRLQEKGQCPFPIIIITASERVSQARCDLPGAQVIAKPFDLDNLLSMIHQNLPTAS